jgi:hypothetical protein
MFSLELVKHEPANNGFASVNDHFAVKFLKITGG